MVATARTARTAGGRANGAVAVTPSVVGSHLAATVRPRTVRRVKLTHLFAAAIPAAAVSAAAGRAVSWRRTPSWRAAHRMGFAAGAAAEMVKRAARVEAEEFRAQRAETRDYLIGLNAADVDLVGLRTGATADGVAGVLRFSDGREVGLAIRNLHDVPALRRQVGQGPVRVSGVTVTTDRVVLDFAAAGTRIALSARTAVLLPAR